MASRLPFIRQLSRLTAPILLDYKVNRLLYSTILVQKLNLANNIHFTRNIHSTPLCFNEHVITIQDKKDFEKNVLANATPIIVDFFATWCGPCKILAPRLESLVAKKKGKVILAKIDIDILDDLAAEYKVTAVPTVFAMKNGKITDKFIGSKDDTDLETFVDKLIL